MSARTAARRRRQAVNNYNHLALIGRGNNNRPVYHKTSADKQARKLQALVRKQREMQSRKGRK